MNSITFSGCSITWGDELNDRLNERYSKLVADHYNTKGYNMSECGISNDAIVRRTIEYLQGTRPDLVVLQFTVTQRIEFFDANV